MERSVKNGDELYTYFFEIARKVKKPKKTLSKGIFIPQSVRKEVLTSIEQGEITLEGQVLTIKFENMTGGVYRAYINI